MPANDPLIIAKVRLKKKTSKQFASRILVDKHEGLNFGTERIRFC